MTACKFVMEGSPGSLSSTVWRCACGGWQSKTPAVGPYGRTSAKARIAQVKMAWGKHCKGLQAAGASLDASGLRLVARGRRVSLGERVGTVAKLSRGTCLIDWDGEPYASPHYCHEVTVL